MSALLYAATALGVLWLVHRAVTPLSRSAALVLVVLPLAITGLALFTGGVYGPIDHLYQHDPLRAYAPQFGIGPARNGAAIDVISEFFPWRLALQDSLRRGDWPLWNAYNLCGHPLAAEAQSAPYLPFTLIALLLPAAESMTYTAAIVLFLAAAGAYLFARELALSEAAALLAATGWAFSASIVLYTQTAMGFATAFLPFLMMATHRRSFGLLVAALSLTALAGHPESLFLSVLVASAYGLFELVRRREDSRRAVFTAIAAGVATLLLCAIFLLPLLDAIPQSYEYQQKTGEAWIEPESNGVVLATLATNFFPHLHVRWWDSPRFGFLPAETAAVGSIVLALALFAVWRVRSAQTWFFAALAVAGIAIGTRWPPLIDFLRSLPLMQITLMERLAFAAALALVMLAAIGFDAIPRRGAAVTMVTVLALLGVGTWWLSRNVVLAPGYGEGRIFAELFFLALAAVVVALRPRFLVPALLGIVVAQRGFSEARTFDTFPARAAYPPIALLEPLEKIREPFRLVGRGPALPPHMNTFYGLEDPRGYEALTFKPFFYSEPLWCGRDARVWFNRVDDLRRPFLSFLNVRFVLQRADENVPPGWRAIASRDGMTLLENERVIERVFVPARVALTDMEDAQLVDRMQDATDFRDVAWIAASTPGVHANGPGRVTLRAYSRGGTYTFDADMAAAGYVVVSDVAWRGWRASVDGRLVKVDRANAAFLAVHVPAGRHEVRLVYRPWSFVIGAWLTILTVVALAVHAVRERRRSGQRSFFTWSTSMLSSSPPRERTLRRRSDAARSPLRSS